MACLLHFRLVGVLVTLWVAAAPARGGQAVAPPQGRWAIMIGDNRPTVVTPQRATAATLRERYGYSPDRVLELYGADATRLNIRERLSSVRSRMRSTDSLFAYVLLQSVERKGTVYFLPTDGRADDIWTLIGRNEIEEVVAGLPTATSLVIINDCAEASPPLRSTSAMQSQASLRREAVRSTLRFCQRTTDLGAGRFAETLTEILKSPALAQDGLTDGELVGRLRDGLQGMDLDLRRSSRYADDGFEFVLERRRADTLLAELAAAKTPEAQVRAVEALVTVLRSSPDRQTQDLIVQGIGGLAKDTSAQPSARLRAIGALGEVSLPSAVPDLTALTKPDIDHDLRRAALAALAKIGTAATLPPLLTALTDPSPTVRVAAVRGAGNHTQLATAAPILSRVGDPDAEVRVAALQTIAILARPQAGGRNLITPVANSAKRTVQRALTDASPNVRREAVNTLGRLSVDLAREPTALSLLTNDADPAVRISVALTLGREYRGVWEPTGSEPGASQYKPNAGRQPALAALIRTAGQPTPVEVRAAAIWALGEIGDPQAEEVLMRALAAPASEPTIVEATIEALGKMRRRAAVPNIIKHLGDEPPRVRAAAALALGMIRESAARAPLLGRLSAETDLYVRRAVEDALNRLPTPSMEAINVSLRDDSPKVRKQAVGRLRSVPDPSAAQFALDALGDDDSDVREEALKVVIERAAAWFDTLSAAAASPTAAVRFGVAVALGELGTPQAGTVLVARVSREPNPAVGAAIVEALGSVKTPTPQIENALLSAALHPDPLLRATAAASLRGYPSAPVREALRVLAEDDEPAVRENAISTLRVIAK